MQNDDEMYDNHDEIYDNHNKMSMKFTIVTIELLCSLKPDIEIFNHLNISTLIFVY